MIQDEHIYVRSLVKGNKEGLNWLFRQYRTPIFHYCLKLLKEKSLAEEATADVFIKVWEKREIINTQQSIRPFLYKIAHDTAYSYLRKVASNTRLKHLFLENYGMKDHKDGEWIYLQKEHAQEVDHIIDTLPRQRRLIFRMRYFDCKDNPTIAEELNLSVHTVKSQLVKARSYVRQELGTLGFSNVYSLFALLYFFI